MSFTMTQTVQKVAGTLPALALTAAALVAGTAHAADMRAWNIHPAGYPNSDAIDQFAAEVAEKTDGEITVE